LTSAECSGDPSCATDTLDSFAATALERGETAIVSVCAGLDKLDNETIPATPRSHANARSSTPDDAFAFMEGKVLWSRQEWSLENLSGEAQTTNRRIDVLRQSRFFHDG
jgi:hypothetical protein